MVHGGTLSTTFWCINKFRYDLRCIHANKTDGESTRMHAVKHNARKVSSGGQRITPRIPVNVSGCFVRKRKYLSNASGAFHFEVATRVGT